MQFHGINLVQLAALAMQTYAFCSSCYILGLQIYERYPVLLSVGNVSNHVYFDILVDHPSIILECTSIGLHTFFILKI